MEYTHLRRDRTTFIHLKPIEHNGKLEPNPIFYNDEKGMLFAEAELNYKELRVLAILQKYTRGNNEWEVEVKVAGFIKEARYRRANDGSMVSEVERIIESTHKKIVGSIVRRHFNEYYSGLTFGKTDYHVYF